jgi:ribosomal protein L25 (general stress protein Ctc)
VEKVVKDLNQNQDQLVFESKLDKQLNLVILKELHLHLVKERTV